MTLGVRYFLLTGVLVGAVGLAGRFFAWPLLTSTVGPTAYVFAAHPDSEAARFRNALAGHSVALGCGLAALAIFGLTRYPSISTTGSPSLRQVAAAVTGVGFTVLLLELVGSHHAPAAATALLITTGLARPGAPLIGLVLGLAIVIALGPLIGRLPLARALARVSRGPRPERVRRVKRTVRDDGFVPIADYALVGDGRTVALVATDGSVDWWPCPTLDAPPLCAALIDPDRGGHFVLRPVGAYEVDRRYLHRTNVLESTYRTSQGVVTVTQALNVGSSGRLPWVEFAHRIVALSGQVTMHWEWRPGDRFGRVAPWITSYHGTPLSIVGDQVVGVITNDAIECTVDDDGRAMRGTFTVEPGNHSSIALVASDHEPLFIPDLAAVDERLSATIQYWCRWSHGLSHAGPWAGVVERSALALKLLLAEDTGAIAAAATTSLPERIGGAKNWDYRFAWVRDTSFTLDALINLGLHEEVQRSVSWLVDAIGRNGPGLHVFYTLGGEVSSDQEELAAPGYAQSRPVRAGNRAAEQTQLGTYGDLFDTIWRYCEQGHVLDAYTARLLADLADQCCDTWRNPDAGLWELTRREHYTISKIGCWVALDRASPPGRRGSDHRCALSSLARRGGAHPQLDRHQLLVEGQAVVHVLRRY